jgi:hypothetical protein
MQLIDALLNQSRRHHMKIHRVLGASLLGLSALVIGCEEDDDPIGPSTATSFNVGTMTGQNERPTNTSEATGTATFTLSGSTINYTINVTGITGVTMAHIHVGGTTKTGPIIVTLLPTQPPSGPLTGVLTTGTITDADITAYTLNELIHLMRDRLVYVNVHTEARPGGEIRGQIVPTS